MSEIRVTAHLSDGIQANAELGKIVEVPVGPDIYTGEYTVTAPSDGDLVLPTNDKLMEDDLTISANHEIEDALIQSSEIGEYVNDRVTSVGLYAFCDTHFNVIKLPNVTTINAGAFNGMGGNGLHELYLPNLLHAGSACCVRNTKLKVVDWGKAPAVNSQFNQSTILDTLILRKTPSLVEPNSTAFLRCPFATDGTGGYVYVPQALLERYQSSQAWQDYAHVLEFRPIEGSEYELEE